MLCVTRYVCRLEKISIFFLTLQRDMMYIFKYVVHIDVGKLVFRKPEKNYLEVNQYTVKLIRTKQANTHTDTRAYTLNKNIS